MIQIDIPLRDVLTLEHAVFDINGTLAVDGGVAAGVAERLRALGKMLSIHALTAGSHGNLEEIERALGIPLRRISTGEEKYQFVQQLGPEKVVAIGNGMNDVGMLRVAALGIAVLSGEGAAVMACQAADVLALGPLDAIDLLLKPKRLIATLRR
jgi:soluble P-type ATPase